MLDKKTKIIATIGQASDNPEIISKMLAKGLDIARINMAHCKKESDFKSLHVPLIPSTENLNRAPLLAKMKSGSILLNCARGGLIDEDALAVALQSGHIAGAGLDVVEPTPPDPNSALLSQENVIVTPHTAFFSQASTLELERRTAAEVVRVLNGETPENLINPDVLGTARSGI